MEVSFDVCCFILVSPESNVVVPLSSKHSRGGGNSSTWQTGDKDEGQNSDFCCVFLKTKSNTSGKGLGEFQTEMERGRELEGEDR